MKGLPRAQSNDLHEDHNDLHDDHNDPHENHNDPHEDHNDPHENHYDPHEDHNDPHEDHNEQGFHNLIHCLNRRSRGSTRAHSWHPPHVGHSASTTLVYLTNDGRTM